MESNPDRALLERWRDGDRQAGDRFVTKFYGPVRRFFTNSVHDDQFQDLTNETFKRLVGAKETFKGDSSARTFLFAIARRVLVDHLRKRYRSEAVGFDPMTHTVEDIDGATPSRAVAALDDYRRLIDGLRALPVDTKMLLELYYWQGCTAEELAEIFEVAPPTIRTRVFAARKKLARWLDTSGEGESAPAKPDRSPSSDEDDGEGEPLTRDLRAVGQLLLHGPASV